MKKLTSAIVALSFVAAGAASVGAQTTPTPGSSDRPATERGTERRSDRGSKPERQTWNNPQLHDTSDIVGTSVVGSDGKKLGKVEALLMDPREGKVSHAVIGMGGMLGIGDEKVVVPYSALKMSGHDDGRKAAIQLDQATLDKAPKYVKAGDRDRGVASPTTVPRSGTTSGSTSPGSTTSDRPASEKK